MGEVKRLKKEILYSFLSRNQNMATMTKQLRSFRFLANQPASFSREDSMCHMWWQFKLRYCHDLSLLDMSKQVERIQFLLNRVKFNSRVNCPLIPTQGRVVTVRGCKLPKQAIWWTTCTPNKGLWGICASSIQIVVQWGASFDWSSSLTRAPRVLMW